MAVGPVALQDGTPILIRPVQPGDRGLLEAAFHQLSQRTRYQRFFRVVEQLRDEELDFFVNVDHDQHEAVGALTADGREGLGIARYVRLSPGSPAAEVAIVVVDHAQGKGLGRILMQELAARARAHGIKRFVAQTAAENRRFRRLMTRLGATRVVAAEAGTVELETEL
jgi:GNAT superfamily N-acetyltransferase